MYRKKRPRVAACARRMIVLAAAEFAVPAMLLGVDGSHAACCHPPAAAPSPPPDSLPRGRLPARPARVGTAGATLTEYLAAHAARARSGASGFAAGRTDVLPGGTRPRLRGSSRLCDRDRTIHGACCTATPMAKLSLPVPARPRPSSWTRLRGGHSPRLWPWCGFDPDKPETGLTSNRATIRARLRSPYHEQGHPARRITRPCAAASRTRAFRMLGSPLRGSSYSPIWQRTLGGMFPPAYSPALRILT